MKTVFIALGIIVAIVVIDRLGLYIESRGWIYWRKRKSSVSAASALEDLSAVFRPSVKHVIEMKRESRGSSDSNGPGTK